MRLIASMIEEGASVIDVACGTGEFAFQNHEKLSKIVGIDLSPKNIRFANKKLKKSNIRNVSFFRADAREIDRKIDRKFDYGIISYALHEMPPEIRLEVINSTKSVSNKLILADYTTPQPKNFMGNFNNIIEFFAGREHYKNYLDFKANGGLPALAEKAEMQIENMKKIRKKSNLIVKIK